MLLMGKKAGSMNYLILQNPGHNRVYYNAAAKMALAELKLAAKKLSTPCHKIETLELGGIRYLSISCETMLSPSDLHILSRLSFVFALYRSEENEGQISLIPIHKEDFEYLDNKISSLLKYQGKTNELFTKMMINVALLSSDFTHDDAIQVLDPVAGKGTTLFESSIYGFDSYGIEIEAKSVHENVIFFKKFLQEERLKYQLNKKQISGQKKSQAVYIEEFEYANTKEEFKSEHTRKKLGLVCGNSQDVYKYFKKERFHLVVGDLPYGIHHGNNIDEKGISPSRNPLELLTECLSGYYSVLKKGGVIIMAWNAFLVSKLKLQELFLQNGFEVMASSPYDEFEHMVDKSIKRDVIVAKKLL